MIVVFDMGPSDLRAQLRPDWTPVGPPGSARSYAIQAYPEYWAFIHAPAFSRISMLPSLCFPSPLVSELEVLNVSRPA